MSKLDENGMPPKAKRIHLILVKNEGMDRVLGYLVSWSIFFSPGKGKRAEYTGWSFSKTFKNKLGVAKRRYEEQYLRHHKLTRDQVEFEWEERQLKPLNGRK